MKKLEKLFFKCTRWQVEETTDLINCPYHYFCDSTYQEDYTLVVDFLVLLFILTSFFSATVFTLLDFSQRPTSAADLSIGRLKRRYLLPSGPIALPLVVLILANGQRINTMFPLSRIGPALLQLVYISALAFRNRDESDMKYSVLEASTISGILHASLHLDSILVAYYTGLAALRESTFSGLCASCVCRKDALVLGGSLSGYRGWSKATVLTAIAICSRMVCRVFGEERLSLAIRLAVEGVSWVFVAENSIGLLMGVADWSLLDLVVYGGICSLIFLNFLRMGIHLLASMAGKNGHQAEKKKAFWCHDVEMQQ
ncbi:uncharacterized protein LOC122011207 [Zingiber officinale]|uniref:uncharacterized protein LOC122011207 n=1 Tax=Zingiber officinale TaxID=94328 RepID=UPI001C4B6082|nr:uncharacterized protein LOC122011207 [Zingiber officinale]